MFERQVGGGNGEKAPFLSYLDDAGGGGMARLLLADGCLVVTSLVDLDELIALAHRSGLQPAC
jgi:hypothetical protein